MIQKGVEIPNTFRMKVKADCFVEYDSEETLADIDFDTLPKPLFHIGSGSNLLFTGDFHGTILHSGIKSVDTSSVVDGIVEATVGSGANGLPFMGFGAWKISPIYPEKSELRPCRTSEPTGWRLRM